MDRRIASFIQCFFVGGHYGHYIFVYGGCILVETAVYHAALRQWPSIYIVKEATGHKLMDSTDKQVATLRETALIQANLHEPEKTAVSLPHVSLLILNWNGKYLLTQYLSSFFNLDYPHYKVVIVDNGSTDDSISFVRTNFPQAKLIIHKQNLGFSSGLNTAMRQINSDIIVLLNNDVSVRPDWLRALIQPIIEDTSIGVVGCKLLYPDGKTLQHAGAELSYPLAQSQHYFHREQDEGQADEMRDVSYVTGAAMAITRSVINKIGLLDEIFSPFYYEETDYCYRARYAGFRVVYVPDAVAIHHESFSMQQRKKGWNLFPHHKNRYRFVMRHYTTTQFLDDFIPAELTRIEKPMAAVELYALRRALLTIKLALPEILQERDKKDNLPAYEVAVDTLRETALAQRPWQKTNDPNNNIVTKLTETQILEEPVFSSDAPVIGSLVATFRQSWNDVSTKWYVRSLIQQQMAFNQLIVQFAKDDEQHGEAIGQEINILADKLLATQRQLEQLEKNLSKKEHDENVRDICS